MSIIENKTHPTTHGPTRAKSPLGDRSRRDLLPVKVVDQPVESLASPLELLGLGLGEAAPLEPLGEIPIEVPKHQGRRWNLGALIEGVIDTYNHTSIINLENQTRNLLPTKRA